MPHKTGLPLGSRFVLWCGFMSRYRNIHCLIWNDDKFPFTSDDCQLVFLHILTSPMCSQFGLSKVTPEALAPEKRWPLKRYQKSFRELLAKQFIEYDEHALLLWLPNFLKYNPPRNPNILKSWGKEFQELPSSPLKAKCYQQIKQLAERLGKQYPESFANSFGNHPVVVQIQDQVQDHIQDHSSCEESAHVGASDFDRFWKVYPRRLEKKKALAAFKLARKSPSWPGIDAVIEAVERAKQSQQWSENNGKFIKYPARWLERGCWDDEQTRDGSGYLELIAEFEEEATDGPER